MVQAHESHVPARRAGLAGRTFQIALLLSLVGISVRSAGGAPPDSDPIRQVAWLMLGAIAAGSLASSIRATSWNRPHFGGLMTGLFLFYAGTSALWSTAPLVTLKRCVLLCIVIIICAGVFGRKKDSGAGFAAIVAPPLLMVIVLSVAYSVIAPGTALTDIGWRGIATHKNELGQVIAVSLLLLICGWKPRSSVVIWILLLTALAGGLLLTRSATSLLALLLALAFVAAFKIPSMMSSLRGWESPLLLTVLVVLTALYAAFVLDVLATPAELQQQLLRALGKSENLTGRTEIWSLVLNETRYHNPMVGGGYGAFWAGMDSVSAYIGRGEFPYPNQAHNGYIDIFNDLGYVGCVLLALVVASQLRMIMLLRASHETEALLHLALLIFVLVSNYGESTLFRGTQFLNLLHLASLIRCSAIVARLRPHSVQARASALS